MRFDIWALESGNRIASDLSEATARSLARSAIHVGWAADEIVVGATTSAVPLISGADLHIWMMEIRERIARDVFGWQDRGWGGWASPKHWLCAPYDQKGKHPYLESPDGDIYYLLCACRIRAGLSELPAWDEDISLAWQIVERLGLAVIPLDSGRWAAAKLDGEMGDYIDEEHGCLDAHPRVWETADTAPLAICRAALAAVCLARGQAD